MLSQSHKNFLEASRLGLSGDRQSLYKFLQKIAISEINKNHHEIHNSLIKLLKDQDYSSYEISSNFNSIKNIDELVFEIDTKNIWLAPIVEKRVNKILQYFKNPNRNSSKNLKRILLHGPPGTGKTTLGFYVSSQLKLPIRYVRVTDMISSRLGETMKNISEVFQAPGREVIFIDEFDAFAKSRVDNNDVGELKRIVNSLIQTLDFVSGDKIVIVATNLIESIDPAILRRFPFKVEVGYLDKKEINDFFVHQVISCKDYKIEISEKEKSFLLDVFCMLELDTVDSIKSIIEKTEVEMTLANRKGITYLDFLEVLLTDNYLSNLKKIKVKDKIVLSLLLKEIERLGYSRTQISSTLGIHRNTYPKYVAG